MTALPDSRRRRWPLVLGGLAVAFALVAFGSAAYVHSWLRASLPQLEGERALAGLGAPVRIERDARGVPVVRGQSRLDVARATGFLHAQERFFQMDLLRRSAAGELAALVGRGVLEMDREVRPLRLRLVARQALKSLRADERDILASYAAGVNAGLTALGAPPFEYLALRARPASWRDEDSLVSILAMYRDLQGRQAAQESLLGLLRETLPPAVVDFVAPVGTEWDAPIEGEAIPMPAIPGEDVLDLRKAKPEAAVARALPSPAPSALALLGAPIGLRASDDGELAVGSNNWAVAGRHTATGGALLANDMHLGLSVPNTWYRLSLAFPGADGERRVTGVTLPGVPLVVAGSNGRVAWGFTNSEGDWADVVLLEPVPGNPLAYLTPEGPRELVRETETIEVNGEKPETQVVLSTIWGPVIDSDHAGRRRALAWVALREGGVNIAPGRIEAAGSLDEALALAPEAGIPNQNLVVADATGRIGWTIIGRIPRRSGHDGRAPTSWADGTNGWKGWLSPGEYPRVVDPPGGRIWTANARVVGGEKLAKVGIGGYDLGARQGQIRDDLLGTTKASEDDMLRVQLDDRALFLARWRKLLLEVLTPQAVAADPRRAEARRLVEGWGGRAATPSVGYRVVRATLIVHPLSRAAQALGPFLDMPRAPLPGDNHMPRVQSPTAGASERFAVSPGREERGYFHMPCGQSGHPLSPHYRDGHAAWARGEKTPFLPGPAVHVLTLVPAP